MKKIWLVSDLHLGHDNIIKYCNRPENYDYLIYCALLDISRNDILINLGDLAFGKQEKRWVQRYGYLPCKKILIRGNHDRRSADWYKKFGINVVDEFSFFAETGHRVLLTHLPAVPRRTQSDINIHGHMHNKPFEEWVGGYPFYDKSYHRLLAIENENYKPVELKEFIERYEG